MKRFRSVIFWCHLVAGALAGIVVLIMSVTGVLLAYERQVTRWADTRDYKIAPPAAEAKRLPVETLLAKAREGQPAAPTSITLSASPDAPVSYGFAGGRTLYANPYTGEVLGEGSARVRSFFRVVTDWHRWLGASGESRATGRAVTGASNLLFLFLVTSGFYLWWPKKWGWTQVRSVVWFRRGLSAKARNFNWHNVIGLWSVAPLFIVVLSGVVISYTWAGNLVYRLAGEQPPVQQQRGGGGGAPTGGQREENPMWLAGLEPHFSRAEQQVAGWRTISLQLPAKTDAPLTFNIDRGNGGQPQKRSQLTLNRATGEVVRFETFANYTTGRRLRSYLRFAHTGEVVGIAGQTIAGLASLGGAFLVWTGLSLAIRRLFAWLGRRRRVAPAIHVPTQQAE